MKVLKTMLIFGFLTVFLAGCINIPIGDGKLKVSKDGITVTDEEGGEHDISFDEENEQLTISGSDGELSFGTEVDIPESFPSDIPMTDDALVIAASEIQTQITVSYGTEMDVKEVDEMYKSYFESNVFEETSDMMMTMEGMLVTEYEGIRKDGKLHVHIQGSGDAEDVTMVILYFEGNVADE